MPPKNQPFAKDNKIILDEDKSNIQVNQSNHDGNLSGRLLISSLNNLLQVQQHPPVPVANSTTLFIPLSTSDQQQPPQPAALNSSLLGYTAIPTFLLSGQPGLTATLDSSSTLTISDMTSSGFSVVPQTIQFVQPKAEPSVQHTGQDVVTSGDNFSGSFVNFPVSEYTVIAPGADHCDGDTVTLEIDLEDQAGGVCTGRFLVEDAKAISDSDTVRIAGAAPFGNVLYLECNKNENDKAPIPQADTVRIAGAAPFENVIYLDCKSENDKAPIPQADTVRITGAAPFENVLYLECKSENEKAPIPQAESVGKVQLSSPMLMIVKKESQAS